MRLYACNSTKVSVSVYGSVRICQKFYSDFIRSRPQWKKCCEKNKEFFIWSTRFQSFPTRPKELKNRAKNVTVNAWPLRVNINHRVHFDSISQPEIQLHRIYPRTVHNLNVINKPLRSDTNYINGNYWFFPACHAIFAPFRFNVRRTKSLPAVILYTSRLNFSSLIGNGYQARQHPRHLLLRPKQQDLLALWVAPNRNYGMLAVR